MVKADSQSGLDNMTGNVTGRVKTMRAYQRAFQSAGGFYFGTEMLHCMSHGSDVAYHMHASKGWRNSYDYFPLQGAQVQETHIWMHAYNAVWVCSAFFTASEATSRSEIRGVPTMFTA